MIITYYNTKINFSQVKKRKTFRKVKKEPFHCRNGSWFYEKCQFFYIILSGLLSAEDVVIHCFGF